MNIFFILTGVSVVGILVVFWLLKNEDKPLLRDLGAPMTAAKPPATPRVKKPSLLAGLFAKFRREKKEAIATVPLPGAADVAEKSSVIYRDQPQAEPAAPPVVLSADEEKKIEQEIDFTAQINEWQGKYERLDQLFNEKSAALEKSEESLRNELSSRKEFNKLKDMLEKELREAKDKARGVQVELNAARTEAEGNRKRIAQLEDKVTTMEKVICGKDNEIAALNKRLQAVASVPSVAAAPELGAPPEPPATPSVPEIPAAPLAVVPAAGEPQQPKEEGFLKLQPDILVAADTAEPEIKKSEPGEPKQSSNPVPPEADPQGPQDTPVSEGKTDQQDEQKKE